MFAFLEARNMDIYSLQNIHVHEEASDKFQVLAPNLPEDLQLVKEFSTKADANAFVKKIQDEIAKIEGVPVIDLR